MIRVCLPSLILTSLLLTACSDDPSGVPQPDSGGVSDLMADTALFEGGTSVDGPLKDAAQVDAAEPDAAQPDATSADTAQPDTTPPDAVLNPDAIALKTACDKLRADYKLELAKARSCNPALSVIQCDTKVDSSLDCPCPIWANKKNTTALQKMATIKAQFKALGCSKLYACPPVPCFTVPQICVGGGGGICTDAPS
jgi:hypothetical protein